MTHYNFIKSVVILFLLYQIIGVIGEVGMIVSYVPYFDGSLEMTWYILLVLGIVIGISLLVYFCITKIDTVLRFFKIDNLFDETNTINLNPKNAQWISLMFILLGMYIVIPNLVGVISDGLRLIQLKTQSAGLEDLARYQSISKPLFIQNIFELILGLLLVTQAKYLGNWVNKRVLENVSTED